MSKLGSKLTPPLVAKLAAGAGFRGAVAYDLEGSKGAPKGGHARLLWSNLEGSTTAEFTRQAAAWRALKPDIKRPVHHWSLSLDPRLSDLEDEQWIQAARSFSDELGYQGCPCVVTRHSDTNHSHVHVTVLRIKVAGDGQAVAVDDSNNFKRGHAAARHAAEGLGLQALPPRDDAGARPAPSDAAVKAGKRATRKGRPAPDVADIKKRFDAALARAATLPELVDRCAAAGLQVKVTNKADGQVQGLSIKKIGWLEGEWLKASNVHRSLAWSTVQAAMAARAERLDLAARAKQQAADKVAEAKVNFQFQRTSTVTKQAQTQTQTRALSADQAAAEAADMARRQPAASGDPLGFLETAIQTHQAPIQAPVRLDDGRREDADADLARERAALEEEIDSKIRRSTLAELQALAKADQPNLPVVGVGGGSLWLILRLLIRVLTLGRVNLPAGYLLQDQQEADYETKEDQHLFSKEDWAAARQDLAERARTELSRRETDAHAAGPKARLAYLAATVAVLKDRRALLGLNQDSPGNPYCLTPKVAAQRVAIEWFSRDQAAKGGATHQQLVDAEAAAVAAVGTLVKAAPTGLAARLTGRAAEHAKRLQAARRRQLEARRQLVEWLDSMETKCHSQIVAEAERIQARQNALRTELKQLDQAIEGFPAEKKAIERDAEQERLQAAIREMREANKLPKEDDDQEWPSQSRDAQRG